MSMIFKRSFFLAALLAALFAAAGIAAASPSLTAAPLNPDFVKWRAGGQTAAAKVSAASAARGYGYAPSPVNWSHLAGVSFSVYGKASQSLSVSPFEVSYDLREKMPSVRQQKPFGNCWTHSAMAATESSLINRGLVSRDIRLSEWYLTYHAYMPASSDWSFTHIPEEEPEKYYDAGGNDWKAVALLSRGTGSVLEAQAHTPVSVDEVYDPGDVKRSYKLTDALYLGSLGAKEIPISGDRREQVKRALKEYGAVSVGIAYIEVDEKTGAEYFNEGTSAFYSGLPYEGTNHAVTIVGWDDEYPIVNFCEDTRPQSNGAWIVRNSWGDDYGDRGYFYVSYEEPSLCDGVAYVSVPEPVNERIYQYDPLGLTQFSSYAEDSQPDGGSGTVWFANVFTAEGDDALNSVSFYTSAPDQSCEISVYTGCQSTPADGKLAAAKTAVFSAPGYHTVVLDGAVNVRKGEKFSVVVKTSSKLTPYVIPCEKYVAKDTENAKSAKGESWVSVDGVVFKDISASGMVYADGSHGGANVCIKAFAAPSSTPTPSGGGSSGGCGCGWGAFALLALLPPVLKRKK
ncbi:lectin like domain-containing protein [Cloacibacillus evryensis]|uniref:lectin like domain-containing protein n=1 Tax=Cloacibacillus evryensis TaxID=508460 RepID=UPI00241C71EB|nr:lectin like domain-containing protein [Cloacibacillus evryensis]